MYTFVHFCASLLSNEMHKKPHFLFLAWVNTNLKIVHFECENVFFVFCFLFFCFFVFFFVFFFIVVCFLEYSLIFYIALHEFVKYPSIRILCHHRSSSCLILKNACRYTFVAMLTKLGLSLAKY